MYGPPLSSQPAPTFLSRAFDILAPTFLLQFPCVVLSCCSQRRTSPQAWSLFLAHPSTFNHHHNPFSVTYSMKQEKKTYLVPDSCRIRQEDRVFFKKSAGLRFHTCMVQELNLVVVLFPEGTPVTFRRLLGGGLGWEENSARVFGQLSLKFLLPFMHFTFSDHLALLSALLF